VEKKKETGALAISSSDGRKEGEGKKRATATTSQCPETWDKRGGFLNVERKKTCLRYNPPSMGEKRVKKAVKKVEGEKEEGKGHVSVAPSEI